MKKTIKNAVFQTFFTVLNRKISVLFMLLLWIFLDDVTVMLGASENSMGLTKNYLSITIGCGVFSMISNCFSNVIRTEGEAMKAMTGTVAGNIINIILDAVFILIFKWGVAGAAIATVIGNVIAAAYYIFYFLRGEFSLSIHPKYFSIKEEILVGCKVKISKDGGNITAKTINGTSYVYIERGQTYSKEKKCSLPKRTCIGV